MCQISLSSIWPDDLNFLVPLSGSSYINDGESVIVLPDQFKDWKVRVDRNNASLDNINLGDPYFTQDLTNNLLNLSAAAVEGEKFYIKAYKPNI